MGQDVLKKASFAGWWEHVVEEKQHNEMRKMQQSMKAKGAESNKRMLGMLLGSQGSLLLKTTMSAWRDYVHQMKQENAASKMEQQLRSKGAESSKRMLGMLLGSQAENLLKAGFAAWRDLTVASKIEKKK